MKVLCLFGTLPTLKRLLCYLNYIAWLLFLLSSLLLQPTGGAIWQLTSLWLIFNWCRFDRSGHFLCVDGLPPKPLVISHFTYKHKILSHLQLFHDSAALLLPRNKSRDQHHRASQFFRASINSHKRLRGANQKRIEHLFITYLEITAKHSYLFCSS